MKTTKFPSLEEALLLHEELISRFGGDPGVRDFGLLQSALGRPQTGYYGSLSLQAAALMQSLVSNHCFVDGNKRMALALTAVFLIMNGFHLSLSVKEGERFIVKEIIQNKAHIDRISKWLEKNMKSK